MFERGTKIGGRRVMEAIELRRSVALRLLDLISESFKDRRVHKPWAKEAGSSN